MSIDSEKDQHSQRDDASKSSLQDETYVRNALSGDQKAYQKLTEKYRRPLQYHVSRMVKESEQVEDLVQEAFVKAFDNLESYNSSYAFSTWLYRITTNHTIDYLRKKKLQTTSIDKPIKTRDGELSFELPDEDAETDRSIIKRERKKIITTAIENLPDKYRQVIEMRHIEELSYQEISDKLDLPLGTVKAHIFRAREMLYKALKDKRHKF
ncbi:sigma-70 family RNA polymerase sigma factor [Rhodohalobacter sp. SW132]|uniref:RNA polymerase sigma factor n=1 Tax=Rhodohalobacter sp. SW132 TaxID=2293433 RepID=UPI000E251E4A|nr:sigma-70 family RNA polymerase sigma factor [Rhodohalobacter sp. SW132]REL24295.1 sigma-70 family RNA polymerase sigma factor [Rhodohalobacter sp. SW132]